MIGKLNIDGKEMPQIYRTDHAIQSTVISSGKHIVELRFEPSSYKKDLNISYASLSIIYLLIVLSFLFGNMNNLLLTIKKTHP